MKDYWSFNTTVFGSFSTVFPFFLVVPQGSGSLVALQDLRRNFLHSLWSVSSISLTKRLDNPHRPCHPFHPCCPYHYRRCCLWSIITIIATLVAIPILMPLCFSSDYAVVFLRCFSVFFVLWTGLPWFIPSLKHTRRFNHWSDPWLVGRHFWEDFNPALPKLESSEKVVPSIKVGPTDRSCAGISPGKIILRASEHVCLESTYSIL